MFFILLLLRLASSSDAASFVDSESLGHGLPLSSADTAQLSSEILHLLDLAPELPPPSLRPRGRSQSFARHLRGSPALTDFMQDVYNELEGEEKGGGAYGGPGIAMRTAWGSDGRLSSLQQRYNVSAWLEDSLHAADLIASVPQDVSVKFKSWEERQRRLVFRFDHLKRHSRLSVLSAELRLFRSPYAFAGEPMRLLLQRLHETDGVLQTANQLFVQLQPGQTGWLEVNISSFATEWLNRPHQNAGLYIRLLNDRGLELPPDLLGFETAPNLALSPFVVASFREETIPSRRRRRSAPPPPASRRDKRQTRGRSHVRRICARRELRVDFKDLNWDRWVIAPRIYPAYYCGGSCPIPLHTGLNITNHSIVQTLLSLRNQEHRRRPVPRPCCVPVALKSMKMLYFDQDKRVMLRTYRDMTVEACGCH